MHRTSEIPQRRGKDKHLLQEREHDPYRSSAKLPEGSTCSDCGAIYLAGRWVWTTDKEVLPQSTLCPACRRTRERVPAGEFELSSEMLLEHRQEILNLIKNIEKKERAEHPMKRILREYEQNGSLIIEFTEAHLVRAVAEAVHRAHGGKLEYCYSAGDMYLRARWQP